jgi:hypothetical protein
VVQADSEELIRPDGGVTAVAANHIEEASRGFVPKSSVNRDCAASASSFLQTIRLVSEALAQVFRRTQGVVLKGLDLDRSAVTRGARPSHPL